MNLTAVIEHCKETGLYVGNVPSLTSAHSQGKTLDELNKNLLEVITILPEDGKTKKFHEYSPKIMLEKMLEKTTCATLSVNKNNKLHHGFESGHRHHFVVLTVFYG